MSRTPMSRTQRVGLSVVLVLGLLATVGGLRSQPVDAKGIVMHGPHAVRELLPPPTVALGIVLHGPLHARR